MQEPKAYKEYFKAYLRLGLPIMIGSMAVVLISWGDTIMISKLGSDTALSASQLANQICSIPFLFLVGISTILAPLVATSLVHKDYQNATKILQHVMIINLAFGLLSTVLIISFSSNLHYLKQPAEVSELAQGYLCIIAISIIPSAINNAVKKYLEALGWTFHTMCLSILAGMVNIVLNNILIHGKLGFPKLGLNGAGWATLATRIIFMGMYLGYVFLLQKKGYILAFSKKLFQENCFTKLFKLGLPSGLDLGIKMGYYAIAMVMFGWCSVSALASTGFLFDILRLIIMLPLAISSSSSILIGRQWGRKNKLAILYLAKTGYILAFSLMIFMGLLLYLVYPLILSSLYESTKEVEKLIAALFGLVILFHFADGLNLVGMGMLRGLQDTLVPFILSASAYLCLGLPASYLAYRFKYHEPGVWFGLMLGSAASACFLSMRFYYKTKHLKLPSHYTSV